MIDALTQPAGAFSAPAAAPTTTTGDKVAFDAALKAAQQAAQRQSAHESEMASIRDKGFTDWARDTRIEKLKEELRRKVMAEMGVDEEQLGRMSAVVQQVLEQKIEEEVEKRLQQQLAEENGDPAAKADAQQPQAGKNDRQGMNCPVIPALVWPGGESLL